MSDIDISKLHILVVDDDVFMRDLIIRMLKEKGTRLISSAENGYGALDELKAAQPKIDVILLDIEMPRMDGFKFIQRMKSDLLPPLSATPVIIISGLSNKAALEKVQELGISLFLLKPVTPEHLVTRINAAMRHRFE